MAERDDKADRIAELELALTKIRDEAFSPQGDDHIWMDKRTTLGLFIDQVLAEKTDGH